MVGNIAEANLTDAPVPARYMLYEQVPYGPAQVSFVLAAGSADAVPSLLEAARRIMKGRGAFSRSSARPPWPGSSTRPWGRPASWPSCCPCSRRSRCSSRAVGVYGMISHSVSRRTRDYGIRLALGLPPAKVVSQVLRRGIGLVAAGSAVGVVAALLLTRLLSSLLYGVRAADPLALVAAVITLLLVGSLAAFVPARRAARTDPVAVLRQQ